MCARPCSSALPSRREALTATVASVAAAAASACLPSAAAAAAAAPGGATRVVLRTAGITPDAAADYLVEALGLVGPATYCYCSLRHGAPPNSRNCK